MVSVVIPAYNEEKYLKKCLESLMDQEDAPDEILVINNNSTDDTVKIAKRFPVRIIHEKKQGMIPARNRGFNEAKYDIIARTDADTIVPRDWISKIKKSFKDEELVGLSGPAFFYDSPRFIKKPDWIMQTIFKSSIRLLNNMIQHDYMYGPNYALRKSTWNEIKDVVCYDEKEVHEDIDMAIHLAEHGKIKFDFDLVVNTSFRRMHKVGPYFEYPHRVFKSVKKHNKSIIKTEGKRIVKKIVPKYIYQFLPKPPIQ